MKSIQIQGIFFEDLNGLFKSTLNDIFQDINLSPEEFARKFNDKQEEVYKIFDERVIDGYIKFNKFNVDEFLSTGARNQKLILNESRDSFYFFILYINACAVLYEKCYEAVKRKRLTQVIKLNLSLYGLILRRSQEIVSMLLSGYSDGAMIIWRSMYEYAIALLIIADEDNNELAKKYIEHSLRNSKKATISYSNNYKELKFKAPSKRVHQIISERELNLKSTYGKEFLDSEFGWADDLFVGKQKANLRNLEDRLKMNRFRPYYLLCTQQTHSCFNGLKKFMIGNKIILPSLIRQDEDRIASIDPMQFTLGVIHEVTHYILYEFSDDNEYEINRKFLTKIYQSMVDSFS